METFPWTSPATRASMREIAGAEKMHGKQHVSAAGGAPEQDYAGAQTALARALRSRAAAVQQAVPGQALGVPYPGAGPRRAVGERRGEAEGADRRGRSAAQRQAAGA